MRYLRHFPIIILCLLFFLAAPVSAGNTSTSQAAKRDRVEIFANRGVLEEVPENTFAALRRIAESGIDGIAVDVRKTKDDQLVLMCDETIDRTTNGKGRVDQLLYAEIKQYDAGSWRGTEFKNERVPLFSDVLEFCKINNLKLILNVRQNYLEKQVLDLVKAHALTSQVYFWGTMRTIDTRDTELQGRELVFVSSEEMSEEKFARIHEDKKYGFSVILENDDRKKIRDRIRMGTDVILMDYPQVAMDIVNMEDRITATRTRVNRETESSVEEAGNNTAYIQKNVNTLVKTIEGGDYDKGRTAAMALAVLPGKYTAPALLKLLENKNPLVKQNAVWALGFCGSGDIGEYVQSLVKDKNSEVRREAVLSIRRLGYTRAIPLLIEALKTETDGGVKYDIARTLGFPGNQGAVFTLMNTLAKEKSWPVKSACVEALGHIGSDKAANALYDILVTDAGEDAAWTRTMAAWALADIGEGSIPFLVKALGDKEEATRRRASWALVKTGQPAVKALISSLHEISPFARERAAQTLGWIGDEGTVTSLMWALKDKEPSVVSAAAWALGRIGSPEAFSALKPLANSKNKDIQENAVEAIGRIAVKKEKVPE